MTTMEKREYIKPSIQIEDILEINMICASIYISDEEINTGGRIQERRGTWGNLWNEDNTNNQ